MAEQAAIYEWRTYDVKVGSLPDYLGLFERDGLPVLSRYAEPAGFWLSGPMDTGRLNQVNHIWRYAGIEQRLDQRMALYEDPAWTQSFAPASLALVERLHSRLMTADGDAVREPIPGTASAGLRGRVVATFYRSRPPTRRPASKQWRLLTGRVGDWLALDSLADLDISEPSDGAIRERQIWTAASFSIPF